jgi:hypothetical protein
MGGDAPVLAGTSGGGDKGDAVSEVKRFFKKLELAGQEDEKALLTNFVLPDDNKALLEFVLAASSRITVDNDGFKSSFYDEWMAKVREASAKAEIIGGDEELLDKINSVITGIQTKDVVAKLKKRKKTLMIAAGVVAVLVAWGIFDCASDSLREASYKKRIQVETQRLETLQTEILNLIEDGNLIEAKLKAADLKWTSSAGNEEENTWEERRQMITREIENTEKKK